MDISPEILVAALNGEATPEELNVLQAWRQADPAHEAHFQELSRSWQGLELLVPGSAEGAGTAGGPSLPVSADEILLRVGARRAEESKGGASVSPLPGRSRWERWGRRAAQLAATLVLGFAVGSQHGSSPVPWFGAQEVVTEPDQVATVRLADGTLVRLAPGSRLGVPDGDEREVTLEGRAYFVVPPVPGQRFRVHTREGTVTVFGTRFDTGVVDGELQVIVVDGQVAMESGGHRLDLKGNEMGRVVPGEAPTLHAVENVYEATAWLGHFLAFESTLLSSAILEMEQRFGLAFEVRDPELLDRTLTGWFTEQLPTDIVTAICSALDVGCTLQGDTVSMQLQPRP